MSTQTPGGVGTPPPDDNSKKPTVASVAADNAELRAQLASMQDRLDDMQRGGVSRPAAKDEEEPGPADPVSGEDLHPEELEALGAHVSRKSAYDLVRLVEKRIDAEAWAKVGVDPDTHVVADHAVKCMYGGVPTVLSAGQAYEKKLFGTVKIRGGELEEWKLLVTRKALRELAPSDLRKPPMPGDGVPVPAALKPLNIPAR